MYNFIHSHSLVKNNSLRVSSFKLLFLLRFFLIFNVLLITIFLAFYLFQITDEISKIYSIKNYKEKIIKLSNENKALEVNLIENNSLDKVAELITSFNFEKVNPNKIHFIKVMDYQIVSQRVLSNKENEKLAH